MEHLCLRLLHLHKSPLTTSRPIAFQPLLPVPLKANMPTYESFVVPTFSISIPPLMTTVIAISYLGIFPSLFASSAEFIALTSSAAVVSIVLTSISVEILMPSSTFESNVPPPTTQIVFVSSAPSEVPVVRP